MDILCNVFCVTEQVPWVQSLADMASSDQDCANIQVILMAGCSTRGSQSDDQCCVPGTSLY